MSFVRIATAGLLLLAGGLSGCGGGPSESQAPAADRPDAGLEASKRLMEMQPPPPPGASKKSHR